MYTNVWQFVNLMRNKKIVSECNGEMCMKNTTISVIMKG